MKKVVCLLMLAGFVLAAVAWAGTAEARPPCPPGYFWDGPRGCMPYGPVPPPPPPPGYYYYPRPCPPGTVWRYGACRPVPPPPGIGIVIPVPPIYIGP